ncbi:MAG: inner membrane-spanning protein YciB [Pseudomonadota bacterium]
MSEREVASWVRPTLEIGPVVVFIAIYILYRDASVEILGGEYGGLVLATLVTIPLILVTTFLLKRITGRLSPMQIFTAVLIVVFGGMTVWLNDQRFIQMKPTIIYFFFTAILLFGAMTGRLYLKMIMDDKVPMADEGWEKLTRRMIIFFAFMAILNEVVWRFFSEEIWVALDTVGQPTMVFVFLFSQFGLFSTYSDEADAQ